MWLAIMCCSSNRDSELTREKAAVERLRAHNRTRHIEAATDEPTGALSLSDTWGHDCAERGADVMIHDGQTAARRLSGHVGQLSLRVERSSPIETPVSATQQKSRRCCSTPAIISSDAHVTEASAAEGELI